MKASTISVNVSIGDQSVAAIKLENVDIATADLNLNVSIAGLEIGKQKEEEVQN